MKRVYNFSAGPSMLPREVLEQAAAEIASVEEAVDSVAAVADSTVAAVDPVVAQ